MAVKNGCNADLDERKAIFFPFAGALPNLPVIDGAACLRSQGGECQLCREACPVEEAVLFAEQEQVIEKTVGAIVVAVGAQLLDCATLPALGERPGADVYTSYAFERLLAQSGPTGGEVVTLRTGKPPAAVAILHCVGSLEGAQCDYCSEVCCQNAFKFNHLIRKKVPGAVIHHLYKELVMPGKDGFALYRAIRDDPASHFIRYPSLDVLRVEEREEGYAVAYTDASGVAGEVTADLVILCPALVPTTDTATLATLLEVQRDRLGFFAEQHNRLAPVQSTVRGIYLAGTCQSPMDLQKAMGQGMAVAGHILSELVLGERIEIEPVTAEVDAERCAGCWVCLQVCPYKAIHRDESGRRACVNALLCAGCGICVAACPAGVMRGNHFTNEAILAEMAGVLA
ncbi:MAG: CoB--CoM heterodisulfide reductase iron-sulfur subunit A family protein [Magnetococcales bacterium]|nr:CoB--CoM heterodisulfide reductase iron-sulfur subunit A family protein [Magnetococcales bacterium]